LDFCLEIFFFAAEGLVDLVTLTDFLRIFGMDRTDGKLLTPPRWLGPRKRSGNIGESFLKVKHFFM
jgi:hypothetical protein